LQIGHREVNIAFHRVDDRAVHIRHWIGGVQPGRQREVADGKAKDAHARIKRAAIDIGQRRRFVECDGGVVIRHRTFVVQKLGMGITPADEQRREAGLPCNGAGVELDCAGVIAVLEGDISQADVIHRIRVRDSRIGTGVRHGRRKRVRRGRRVLRRRHSRRDV
jgi:hypothetical protein